MNASQEFPTSEPEDRVELSKQGYFTILLDENLRGLEQGLEDDGFKVIVPSQGLKDEALKRKARGWAILTRNSQDFVDEAVRYDYDVIGIEDIKFVDDKPDRTNETVRKISGAVRRSQLGTRKGNFRLKIRDNGSFHLEQLV
jgi:hypothetical protein